MNSLFAYNIKAIRTHLGMSQEQFGEEVGATRAMIMTYEQRGSEPNNHGVIMAIEELSGCTYKMLCSTQLTQELLSEKIKDPRRDNPELIERIQMSIRVLKSSGTIKRNGDIAEDLGYRRQGTISEIINGKKPASGFIKKFCIKYNISYKWLTLGEGWMFKNEEDISQSQTDNEDNKRIGIAISALITFKLAKNESDIASTIGVSRSTISEIQNNRRGVSRSIITKLCASYPINVEFIKNGLMPILVVGKENVDYNSSDELIDNEFSIFLRERRREFGLTKAMLAHFSGKPLADITAWEEGTQTASPETQADLYLYFKSLPK